MSAPPTSAPRGLHVFTMVLDEEDYLAIWLRHWKRHLPGEALHVLCHGENQALRAMCDGVDFQVIPRPAPYETMEEDRWEMLSNRISAVAAEGAVAVYTDVDEILVADPKAGAGLVETLRAASAPVLHTTGLELIHRQDREPEPIDPAQPILRQRQIYRTTSFHSKPCIVTAPVRWGRGGHFTDRPGMAFAPGLYTIHLRFYDMDRFLDRARSRRKTTKARPELTAVAHRKWRNSEEEAQSLVTQLQAMRAPRLRSLVTWPLQRKMRRSLKTQPNAQGLYRYQLFSGRLQRLPERMLDLF